MAKGRYSPGVRAGSLYLIFIGLLLCAAGGAFAWLMWRSFDRAAGQREWAEVECTLLSSRIDQRKIGVDVKTEYSLGVVYGYTYKGTSYTSERFSLRGAPWSSSEEKAKLLQEEYPEGATLTCHVDPAEPTFAVLRLDSKGPGYSLWFPLLFVVGGLGVIVGAVRNWIRQGKAASAEPAEA